MCEGTRSLLSISVPADGWPRHTWIAWKIRGNLWASRGKSYIWVIDSIQYYCDFVSSENRHLWRWHLVPSYTYVPGEAESREWFTEGQTFSRSYDLASRPISPPLPSVSRPATHRKTDKDRQVADGRGRHGVGEEPNHSTARRKPVPL